HGLLVCSLPMLGKRFYYADPATLRSLAIHYVQQHLEGLTPAELSRYLPPAAYELDEIVVRVDARSRPPESADQQLPTLRGVAEPLGDPKVRKLYARPWERDREVADLVQRLGKERANVLLVGEPGSGKTTVLAEAVKQVEKEPDDA